MRRICIIMAGLIIFIQGHSQTRDDKKTTDIISRNHLKSQVNWDYAYKGSKLDKNGTKTSVTLFDDLGNVAQVTTFNPKGAVINIEKFKYDSRGNKTEYSRYQGNANSDAAYQKLSKYNSKNLVTEETGYDGVEHFTNTYSYDSDGNLQEIKYLKNNLLSERRVFSKTGNNTSVSIYNATGILTSRLLLKYDEHTNLIEETVYGVNQSELEKKTYNYDNNKNLKEEAKYKLDKITLRTFYNYDSSGNLLDISEENPGSAKYIKKSYAYDGSGNLMQIKWRRNATEDFNQITYSYNQNGLCVFADTWYPATKYKVRTKYVYE
jgi:hypothetical protein